MTFTWLPDYGASKDNAPNISTVQYGDGYSQRQVKGINIQANKWTLRFSARDDAETLAIETFLATLQGVQSFDWTPPKETTAIKVICPSWPKTLDGPKTSTITATFLQVFEP